MLALVVEPMRRFWPLDPARSRLQAVLFALFVFCCCTISWRSDFLESDEAAWFAFLLVHRGA